MTIADLKEAAAQLGEAERAELSAHLIMLGRKNDPTWRKELSRRMRAMDSGSKVTAEEFDRRLADDGS